MNNFDEDRYNHISNNIDNLNSTTNSSHFPINTISDNVIPLDIQKNQPKENRKFLLMKKEK